MTKTEMAAKKMRSVRLHKQLRLDLKRVKQQSMEEENRPSFLSPRVSDETAAQIIEEFQRHRAAGQNATSVVQSNG